MKIKLRAFRSLKRYAAIQGIRNHKVGVIQDKRSTRLLFKALVGFKVYSKKRKDLSEKRNQIEAKRKSVCKFKVLHAWNKRQLYL